MGEKMWFGTEDYMGWIPAPVSGAEMSPAGWGEGGTLLSGGGYENASWGSHKVYTFSWSDASSLEIAQLMKSYSDGTYGRGLLYFIDPLAYRHNILPARVADPSMAIGDESSTLIPGVTPTASPTTAWQGNRIPVAGATYNLNGAAIGFPGEGAATFIPIPEGCTLHLGAFHEATGTAGIFASPQTAPGVIGAAVALTKLAPNAVTITPNAFSGVSGVWLWAGKTTAADSTLTARAIIARISTPLQPAPLVGPWIGGMGHSGCRWAGRPTWTANTGVDGGQVGLSASFREVGSWRYAG